jgi:hypothetical protein
VSEFARCQKRQQKKGCREVAAIWQHTLVKFNLELSRAFLTRNYVPKALRLLLGLGMLGMHRFAIVGAGLLSVVGFANAASAADLPVKAIAAAPVPFSWTGCHVGGNIGGVVSDDRTTGEFGKRSASVRPDLWEADRSAAIISSRPAGSRVSKLGQPGPT